MNTIYVTSAELDKANMPLIGVANECLVSHS